MRGYCASLGLPYLLMCSLLWSVNAATHLHPLAGAEEYRIVLLNISMSLSAASLRKYHTDIQTSHPLIPFQHLIRVSVSL